MRRDTTYFVVFDNRTMTILGAGMCGVGEVAMQEHTHDEGAQFRVAVEVDRQYSTDDLYIDDAFVLRRRDTHEAVERAAP